MSEEEDTTQEQGAASSAVGSSEIPEAKKPSRQILREEISEGVSALRRPIAGLFLSGLSAGLDIGFSLLLLAAFRERNPNPYHPESDILEALIYSLGFIFVTLGRSELFTEHTTLAVLPVLSGQTTFRELGRLWAVVYISNLIGAAIFAAIAVYTGPRIGLISLKVFGEIGAPIVQHPPMAILLSAILAGWLMGLLSWLVTAARDTISQIFIVAIVAGSIGFMHLHHSIVGSVETLSALFAGQGVTVDDYWKFLLWTTLGNAFGGTVFVALVKYGHATRVDPDPA